MLLLITFFYKIKRYLSLSFINFSVLKRQFTTLWWWLLLSCSFVIHLKNAGKYSTLLKLKKNFFWCLLFIFEIETEYEQGRGRERKQNPKQAPGSELSAQSLVWGSNSRAVRSWPSQSRMLNWLSYPGAPLLRIFLSKGLYNGM